MTKISFLRQQDIHILCDKVKKITEQVKKKQKEADGTQGKMDSVKESNSDSHFACRMGDSIERKECFER